MFWFVFQANIKFTIFWNWKRYSTNLKVHVARLRLIWKAENRQELACSGTRLSWQPLGGWREPGSCWGRHLVTWRPGPAPHLREGLQQGFFCKLSTKRALLFSLSLIHIYMHAYTNGSSPAFLLLFYLKERPLQYNA